MSTINAKLQAAVESINAAQPKAQTGTTDQGPIPNEDEVAEPIEWNRKSIHFGNVAPGTNQPYSFNYLGGRKIQSVQSSCGCTTSKNEDNVISGVWVTSHDLSWSPQQLVPSSKEVYVTFEDGTKETLTLSATLNKKLFVITW